MPYITTDRVKEVRKTLKAKYPSFKLSVTRENHSTIQVTILEAPFEMRSNPARQYEQVNTFYIKELYKGETGEVLEDIKNIMREGQKELVNDGDYGSVPTFYISLHIGSWDKGFKVVS